MRDINKIILHCSATKEGQEFDVNDIIINENKSYVGKDVANEAIEKINNKNTKEEVEADVKEEKKTRRVGRPRKNA